MTSLVNPYGRTAAANNEGFVQGPRSTQEIYRTLRSVDANFIDCVCQKIVSNIMSNVGPVGHAKVHAKVSEIRFPDCSLTEEDKAKAASLQHDPAKKNFLSEEKFKIVEKALQEYFVNELTYRLSVPEYFFSTGLQLEISDYEPTEVIQEAFAKAGMTLGMDDVPRKYVSGVIWDKSNKTPGVFAVIFLETSDGVVFNKSSIALKV